MKKISKIIVTAAVVATTAFIGTYSYLSYKINKIDIKEQLEKSLSTYELKLNNIGNVSYTTFPTPIIIVSDVKISINNIFSQSDLVIETLSLKPNISSIFSDEISYEKIKTDNVKLTHNTNTFNSDEVLKSLFSEKTLRLLGSVSSIKDLEVDNISITEAPESDENNNTNLKKLRIKNSNNKISFHIEEDVNYSPILSVKEYLSKVDINIDYVNSDLIKKVLKNPKEINYLDGTLIEMSGISELISKKDNSVFLNAIDKTVISKKSNNITISYNGSIDKFLKWDNFSKIKSDINYDLSTNKLLGDLDINVLGVDLINKFNIEFDKSFEKGSAKLKSNLKNLDIQKVVNYIIENNNIPLIPVELKGIVDDLNLDLDLALNVKSKEIDGNVAVDGSIKSFESKPFGLDRAIKNLQDKIIVVTKDKKLSTKEAIKKELDYYVRTNFMIDASSDNTSDPANISFNINVNDFISYPEMKIKVLSVNKELTAKYEADSYDIANDNAFVEVTVNDKNSEFYKLFGEMPILLGHNKVMNLDQITQQVLKNKN